jgi:hypothetical protein
MPGFPLTTHDKYVWLRAEYLEACWRPAAANVHIDVETPPPAAIYTNGHSELQRQEGGCLQTESVRGFRRNANTLKVRAATAARTEI